MHKVTHYNTTCGIVYSCRKGGHGGVLPITDINAAHYFRTDLRAYAWTIIHIRKYRDARTFFGDARASILADKSDDIFDAIVDIIELVYVRCKGILGICYRN